VQARAPVREEADRLADSQPRHFRGGPGEQAVNSVAHHFRDAARAERDHRNARHERFQDDARSGFVRRRGLLIWLAVPFTVADRALALARCGVDSAGLAAATSQYDRYQRWRLPGTAAGLWYSGALLNVAMQSPDARVRSPAGLQSVVAGLRATTAGEPFDARTLAQVYAAANHSVRTESCLRAAIAASPNWFKRHGVLAQLLRLESRTDDAEREADLAARLNGGKNSEVARTLAEICARRAALRPW